jgi:dephospho-CoA kinase
MRIGLTGGVGSGASLVARRLETKDATILSGDEEGHAALALAEVKNALREHFGSGIFDAQGEVDRSALSGIIFRDETARKALNRIVHPALLDILISHVRQVESTGGVVVVDAALIYEWGIAGFFHRVIVVDAPLETRIQRVMQRDGLSREQVLQRIEAQWPLEKKVEQADYVIDNRGTIEELYRRVDEIWAQLSASQQ